MQCVSDRLLLFQISSVGLIRAAAVLQRPARLPHHGGLLQPGRGELRRGELQHPEALRQDRVVAQSGQAQHGECVQNILVGGRDTGRTV